MIYLLSSVGDARFVRRASPGASTSSGGAGGLSSRKTHDVDDELLDRENWVANVGRPAPVIEESEGLASAAAGLGLSLLEAKLSVPRALPGSVSRAPLIQTARESHRRVVGVTAPAGYGKSTLLAEWARMEDRPVAWVSLDNFDDDPAAFLFSLASAYGRVSPDGEALIADVGGLGVGVGTRGSAPRLRVQHEPTTVRAHAGRPTPGAITGLPRRIGGRDEGDTSRVAAGRGEP